MAARVSDVDSKTGDQALTSLQFTACVHYRDVTIMHDESACEFLTSHIVYYPSADRRARFRDRLTDRREIRAGTGCCTSSDRFRTPVCSPSCRPCCRQRLLEQRRTGQISTVIIVLIAFPIVTQPNFQSRPTGLQRGFMTMQSEMCKLLFGLHDKVVQSRPLITLSMLDRCSVSIVTCSADSLELNCNCLLLPKF